MVEFITMTNNDQKMTNHDDHNQIHDKTSLLDVY